MPKSPRATMTASVSRQIDSKFSRPSWFSIFEMIFTRLPPASSRVFLMVLTSSADCTNDAATKSTGCLQANSSRSLVSFSCSTGKSTTTPR